MADPKRGPGKAPDEASLHRAGLAHLARYAATEAGLRRVLERRVDRWARAAGAAGAGLDPDVVAAATAAGRAAAARVAQRLAAAGAIDDTGFATARAARLHRSGKSRRAIAAHLGARGIAAATVAEALPDAEEAELDAALVWCRKRRAGPFARPGEPAPDARRKALAAMARAGFPAAAAIAALDFDPDAAATRLQERA